MEHAKAFMEAHRSNAIALCEWFRANARELPWRELPSPYHVWISEIMLQQTRVEAVKPYYMRFMERLPDVQALANCPESVYLKLWEGLGYYSRVRNLHAAAEQIMEQFDGRLPASKEELLQLKGIGSYTAGAIASIAFGLPEPAVDGNVLRVLMRLMDCKWDIAAASTKKQVETLLADWLTLDGIRPGELNQALMELGALVCVPNGAPHCADCPWQASCRSCQNQTWDQIPVKTPKRPRRIEEKTVFVIQNQDGVFFHKRASKGLLAGLYEFPNVEGFCTQEEALEAVKSFGLRPIRIRPITDAKHIFTHIEWHMKGYAVMVELGEAGTDLLYVDVEQAQREFSIPSAFRAYKQYIGVEVEK
ncbi:A/G-specific adenine glycosylase [Agathobacter ruminis]|nr:A/G-specific adenine glycosylase [Agathobacter ruminis]MDC7300601.1 A/G-specific adenine glycosylase [Agathobacter ruminis]